MDAVLILERLTALAQETRLAVFRLLVEAGDAGVSAGTIAERLGLAGPTLSFHMSQLVRAGLVLARQKGRFIYYSANFVAMDELIAYLSENCCRGKPCLPKAAANISSSPACLEEPT